MDVTDESFKAITLRTLELLLFAVEAIINASIKAQAFVISLVRDYVVVVTCLITSSRFRKGVLVKS